MAVNRLISLAAKAPVPVFAVTGASARDAVQDLALDARVTLVDSPRHARLLLVAGTIASEAEDALRRIHDQVPSPMATLWWGTEPLRELSDGAITAAATDHPGAIASRTYQRLLTGEHAGERLLCSDEPPAPWEGLGDDGHGGEGMMGGKPFGRPMAMPTGDIRDGLQLDPMDFTLGPFWPPFPPGLCARISLHGDVMASFEVVARPFPTTLPAPFSEALDGPVPIAELELARARYHLRQLSRSLHLNGPCALSRKLLQRIAAIEPGDRLNDIATHLRRVGFFSSAGAGAGELTTDQLEQLGGPPARADQSHRDAREDDPAYQQLDFTPVRPRRRDCAGRWQQWLDEAHQSLALAARAKQKDLSTTADHAIESPRGRLTRGQVPGDASHILEDLLPGLEWSDAVATIASLDLAAPAQSPSRQHPQGSQEDTP